MYWPRPDRKGGAPIGSGGGWPPRRPRGGFGRRRVSAPIFPADLAIVADAHGRPRLLRIAQPDDASSPAISIAHCDGVALALAATNPSARPGIDVEAIVDRDASFETSAFTPQEKSKLDRWTGSSRNEWIARFWCAKEAAAKASGVGLAGGPAGAEVVQVDPDDGTMVVKLSPLLLADSPDPAVDSFRVITARRADYAWAWTLGEGAQS